MATLSRILPVVALGILLGGCAAKETLDPTPAPDFTLQTASTPVQIVHKKDFAGKVVLIDFWATWCGPCKVTMPAIQKLYDANKAKGFDVIAITDEMRSKVLQFRKDSGINYPMYIDNVHTANLGFNVTHLPQMFLINKKGEVVYAHTGGDLDADQLEQLIQANL